MPTDAELEQLYAHHRENEDRYAQWGDLKAKWDALPEAEKQFRLAFKRDLKRRGLDLRVMVLDEGKRLRTEYRAQYDALAWLRGSS